MKEKKPLPAAEPMDEDEKVTLPAERESSSPLPY